MTPTTYAAAVVRRWPWTVLGALLGALLLAVVAPAPTYEAGAELYVGVARIQDQEEAVHAALVRREVLPTLVELATASGSADGTTVEAGLVEDTSLLHVTVSAPDPQLAAERATSVVDAVRNRVEATWRAGDGTPLLRVTTVTETGPPPAPASADRRTLAVLGLGAGAALAALAAGLAELARPRVHTAADVPGVTVLAELGGSGRSAAARRAGRVERLRWLLGAGVAGRRGQVALVGATRRRSELAGELAAGGVLVVDGDGGPGSRPDAVVVVAEAGRTTVRGLAADLDAAQDGGVPVAGVVLDGRGRGGRVAAVLARADRTGAGRPWSTPSGICALLALAVAGADLRLPMATTSGLLVAALLLPVWISALPRYRGAVPLAVLTGLGLLCGLLLARQSAVDHTFDPLEAATTAAAVLTGLGTVGLLLWARTVLPLRAIGIAFGLGQLVAGLLRSPGSENAFKFELSLPLTVVALSLLAGRRRPAASVAVLGLLGVADVLNDARSAFAFCVGAAALVLWQARPARPGRTVRWVRGALVLGTGAVVAYALLTDLLLSGALGSGLQARTTAQVAQSGSLLLSSRPEWTATWSLLQHSPLGFGLGTVPSAEDVEVAGTGIAVVNDPTAQGYLHHYLLAGRFELHSVVADLWSNLGPVGLLLGLTMAGLVVTATAARLSRRRASALLCFLAPAALWYLAFGPLPSDLDVVVLAVGLALLPRADTAGPARPREEPARADAVPQPV
ncbi:hypothetical protein [Geodermatophilus sp. SYSU D01036]